MTETRKLTRKTFSVMRSLDLMGDLKVVSVNLDCEIEGGLIFDWSVSRVFMDGVEMDLTVVHPSAFFTGFTNEELDRFERPEKVSVN